MLTAPYQDASTGKEIMSVAAPIYNESGDQVLGVAGVDISLDHINEICSQYKIGNKGYIVLLTEDGTMVYHPTKENELKKLSEANISDDVMNALKSKNDENGEEVELGESMDTGNENVKKYMGEDPDDFNEDLGENGYSGINEDNELESLNDDYLDDDFDGNFDDEF